MNPLQSGLAPPCHHTALLIPDLYAVKYKGHSHLIWALSNFLHLVSRTLLLLSLWLVSSHFFQPLKITVPQCSVFGPVLSLNYITFVSSNLIVVNTIYLLTSRKFMSSVWTHSRFQRSLFGCLTGISNSEFSETNSWFLIHLPLQHDTHTHHLLPPHPPPCMSFGQDQNLGPPWRHFRIHQQIQLTLLSHSIQTPTTYHLHYHLPAPNHHLQQPFGCFSRLSHISSTHQPQWCFSNRCKSCHFSAQSLQMTLQITQNKIQQSYNGLKILILSGSSSFSDSAFPLSLYSACQPLAVSQTKFLLAEIEFSQTV